MTKTRLMTAAAALFMASGFAAQASAATITLDYAGNWDRLPGVFSTTQTFFLPANAINTVLSISAFAVDDRGILSLNNAGVDATGIFADNGTIGRFNFTQGAPSVAYAFNRAGARSVNVTTGFVLGGNNAFTFLGNDTGNGINGETLETAQQSGYTYTAQVTYDLGVAAVPEPASWAMMILGMGAIGVAMRRRSTTVRYA